MADKVKGKKTKTLSKKSGARVRKPEAEEVKIDSAISLQKKQVRTNPDAIESKKVIDSGSEASHAGPISPLPPLEQKFVDAAEKELRSESVRGPKANASGTKPESEADILSVKLSRSLLRKLKDQALDEGISLEDFVCELLAESVVLRAWEIVERKNQMKGSNNAPTGNNRNAGPSGPHNPNRGQRGNKGGGGGGNRGGMNPLRYQNIMEDKATFLEYVRNQERNRR